jgi:hypothetical protein
MTKNYPRVFPDAHFLATLQKTQRTVVVVRRSEMAAQQRLSYKQKDALKRHTKTNYDAVAAGFEEIFKGDPRLECLKVGIRSSEKLINALDKAEFTPKEVRQVLEAEGFAGIVHDCHLVEARDSPLPVRRHPVRPPSPVTDQTPLTFGQRSRLKRYIIDVDLIKDTIQGWQQSHYVGRIDSGVKTAEQLIDALCEAGFSQVEVRTLLEDLNMGDIADEAGLATPQDAPDEDSE